jgi:ribosomal protein S19E (S16A)
VLHSNIGICPYCTEFIGERLSVQAISVNLFSAGASQRINTGGLVKSRFTDDFVKSSKFKARPPQAESWTFYEVVKKEAA